MGAKEGEGDERGDKTARPGPREGMRKKKTPHAPGADKRAPCRGQNGAEEGQEGVKEGSADSTTSYK